MKRTIFGAALISLWLSVFAATTWCDSPPTPPGDRTVYSLDRRFLLFSDYKQKRTILYRLGKQGKRTKSWETPGWFDNTALSNDGEHFVVVHAGGGLLNLDYKPDELLFSFHRRDETLGEVRLNQLYRDPRPESLERTVSHYAWSRVHGFDTNNHYVVTTIDGREFVFDVATGKPIGAELFADRQTGVNAEGNNQSPANGNGASANVPASGHSGGANNGGGTAQQENRGRCLFGFGCLACAVALLGGESR